MNLWVTASRWKMEFCRSRNQTSIRLASVRSTTDRLLDRTLPVCMQVSQLTQLYRSPSIAMIYAYLRRWNSRSRMDSHDGTLLQVQAPIGWVLSNGESWSPLQLHVPAGVGSHQFDLAASTTLSHSIYLDSAPNRFAFTFRVCFISPLPHFSFLPVFHPPPCNASKEIQCLP